MNKEMKTRGKLPITARLGKGKGTTLKNARNNITGGKVVQVNTPQLKITRTIGRGKEGVEITTRNLIARGGKILRIKKKSTTTTLNSGKILGQPIGRRIFQTKNVKSITQRLGPNLNTSSVRKVEFDDQGGLEIETSQDNNNFMGNVMENVNYGLEPMPAFPQVPLLPTPPIQQQIFPIIPEPFHHHNDNSHNLMNVNMDNIRNLEMQNAQKYEEYQEELMALERKRVEKDLREMERKRIQEMREIERKRMEEMRERERNRIEEMKLKEEQKRFEEELRQFEDEQRMIDEERRNLDELRGALEKEKQNLEILKKTVEEENERERRSAMSKGRGNFTQNQKFSGRFDNNAKKNTNENRGRFNARANNSNRQYGKDFISPSQRRPVPGLLDFLSNETSGGGDGWGGSEKREMGINPWDRGGGRGMKTNNTRGGQRGGGGRGNNTRGRGGNNKNVGYDQSSKFNDYNTRDSSPQSYRKPAASSLMSLMFDTEPRDAPSYSQAGNFNESDNYYPNDFDMSRRGEYDDMSRRGEYNDMSRRGEYDDMSRRGEYDDMSKRGEYNDMSRRGEYNDMSRRGEYDDMSRRGEYDMSRRGEYDDMSRGGEQNYSGGNNNSEYLFQRGSSTGDEMNSNQNRNYGIHTQSGYQILSRGFNPVKEDEQKTQYQSTNNFGSYQESFAGHPYYDDFYDQGRINRNQTENSGKLGSSEKQGTWRGTSFPSRAEKNKFGFVGYPFRNKSPIYTGPRGASAKTYNSNNQSLGFRSNNANQQEKPTDTFYSYRPSDKQTNNSVKGGKSGSSGIDILGGGTSLMASSTRNSLANLRKNSARSYYGSDFFGKVVQNPNKGTTTYSNSNSSRSKTQ